MNNKNDLTEINIRKIVYESDISKLEEVNIKTIDNKEIKIEVFNRGNTVSALVYNTNTKKFIFTEQYRAGSESIMLEIPSGVLKDLENPKDCVKKIITEEIGFKCDKIIHIFDYFVSPETSTEVNSLFFVEVSDKICDNNEKIKIVEVDELGLNGNVFFNTSTTEELIPPYKLIDSKSIIAVNWYVTKEMMKDLWNKISDYKLKSLW